MADIFIEDFDFNVIGDGSTCKLQNDVGDSSTAFIKRNCSTDKASSGPIGDTGNCNPNVAHCGVMLTDTSTLTFYKNTSTEVKMMGEVWRYVGSEGGDNEFRVRYQGGITVSGTDSSAAIGGIVNEDKCVPFLLGLETSESAVGNYEYATFAVHIDNGHVVVSRNNSGTTATVYVVVVEFTGSNWSIGHGISSSHDSATETVTLNTAHDGTGDTFDVEDWETAFLEASMEGDSAETGLADVMALCYPHADTDKVYFSVTDADAGARNDGVGYIQVIKHDDMIVKRDYDSDLVEGNNTYNNEAFPAGVDASTALNQLALEWFVSTSGTGTAHARCRLGAITDPVTAGLTYNQGDPFNSGDYNSTEYGKWVFDIEFDASPSGVLVEAGGTGTGMAVFYSDGGDFVARGGDGGSTAPSDAARIVIPSTTYDFSGKSGILTVEISVTDNRIDLEWDEGDTGSVDYSDSSTATSSFSNWSGGNDGYCGDSNGTIAGSEITSNYTFNGTINSMFFTQVEDTDRSITHWVHRSGNTIKARYGVIDVHNIASAITGWPHNFMGVLNANIGKISQVSLADINAVSRKE